MTLFHDTPLAPLRRILVANRGEIAIRILRACRDEGIEGVAVFTDTDRDAAHLRPADAAYALPGGYLDGAAIIDAALRAGAGAIHPGYGFLSENADFARAVQAAGLVWIGPDPQVIDALGDKIRARDIARAVGAPLVAGSPGPVGDAAAALAFARDHGLPVAIKAAHGGGGRGMRVARALDEVEEMFDSAVREAVAAFGRGECYLERFLDRPRHVEVQILADRHGCVKVLGTRDCSLQRRNQKLVEEAPAPFLDPALRARLHEAARAICAHAGYSGAGTVEFLLSADGTPSFLEVNTRLQVEHPVTEETTGIDIVRAMIAIARGARLASDAVPDPVGHAIEFRINAEDPGRGFLPTPGPVTVFAPPGGIGVRLDAGVEQGGHVPGAYDSLMAKLIVTGPDRPTALARAARALAEFRIEGVASVLPFHRRVIEAPEFRAEDGRLGVHTRWIETEFADRLPPAPRVTPVDAPEMLELPLEIDGRRHMLRLPRSLLAGLAGPDAPAAGPTSPPAPEDPDLLRAPVAGILSAWQVEDGAAVRAGQAIATIEAMKMETRIEAHRDGILQRIAPQGDSLAADAPLARIARGPRP